MRIVGARIARPWYRKVDCMEQDRANYVVLASADTGEFDAEVSIEELRELSETAGAQVVAEVIQKRNSLDSATVLGEGKIIELKGLCAALEAELIIFDTELSASQIRNIEKLTEVRVIDRTMLILDIFATRAMSREGKLQVELAQLRYRLPRLVGLGVSLSRLGGGIGTRGPGETKLETDRRHIRRRIDKLVRELKELQARREFSRSRRKKDEILTGAIVGYTNAGKSTLLNALTGAEVLAEDKLFATLDPTARAIELPDGRSLLLIDTVGLIRRLPHHLIEAFKSTLEEAANADIILHVRDISDDYADEKAEVSELILNQLGCGGIPVVSILNKSDKFAGGIPESDTVVKISAKEQTGLPRLLEIIAKNLPASAKRMKLLLPFDKVSLSAKIRQNGKIFSEEFTENGVILDALVEEKLIAEVAEFSLP